MHNRLLLTAQCIGTEVPLAPQMFRAPHDPIAIHHSKQALQIWAKAPLSRRVRVVIVDYCKLSRNRSIMGCIWFGTVPGDMEVSDFRVPIGLGRFPEIMKAGTIYILGVRFLEGPNQTIPLTLRMRDNRNEVDFTEHIELVHVGGNTQYIKANAAISERAKRQHKPQEDRYVPKSVQNTKVDPIKPRKKVNKPFLTSTKPTLQASTSKPKPMVPKTTADTSKGANKQWPRHPKPPKKKKLWSNVQFVTGKWQSHASKIIVDYTM